MIREKGKSYAWLDEMFINIDQWGGFIHECTFFWKWIDSFWMVLPVSDFQWRLIRLFLNHFVRTLTRHSRSSEAPGGGGVS